MTKHEFARSYQLLRQITRGDVQTHHALASTGAVVMVHVLRPDGIELKAELLGLIERLASEDRQRVLLVDDVDGTPFIVTRFLLEFSSLREWLEAAASSTDRAGPTAEPSPAAGPGEFTRAFRAVAPAAPTSPEHPGLAAQPPPQTTAPPGEFTRIFGAPQPPAHSPVQPEAVPPVQPPTRPAPPAGVPGEFTRVFGGPPPEATPPIWPAPTSPTWGAPNPAEDYLARLSGAAGSSGEAPAPNPPEPSAPATPNPPAGPAAPAPGSWAFDLPGPPPPPPQQGEFTRIISGAVSAPRSAPSHPQVPAPPPVPAAPTPPQPGTVQPRMPHLPPPQAIVQQPMVPQAPTVRPPAMPPSQTWLVLGLGFVIVATLAVLVLLVLAG